MRLLTFSRAVLLPSAATALLLLASPATAGEDELFPRREVTVEVEVDQGEATAVEATESKLQYRVQAQRCDAAETSDDSSSRSVNAADRRFDWIHIRPELVVDFSHGEDGACQVEGSEGRLLLTFELGEGRGDFVLDKTAQEIEAAAACAGECRCPHCGTAMRPAGVDFVNTESCPPLQAGEAAREIMEIREQVNPAIGLPSWEFLPGTDCGQYGSDVLIRTIRAHEANLDWTDGSWDVAARCEETNACQEECPAACVEACPVDSPAEYAVACPAAQPAASMVVYSNPPMGYAPMSPSPSYMPAPQATWTAYADPPPYHAERQAVQMLRDSGHQLDCTAHALESQGHYEQADLLREMAGELREQAREAQHEIDHPEPPQPHAGAEYSEAGLRDEIRQLRDELRQGREHGRYTAPLGIER